ncbi:putative type IV pilin [Vibrio ichthyoenteri ATCC 700023]|uniref:Putative type IV pilin n=1 Tax=Vibrio ichthyoenteri ATCC 700023 TaxID=870968 RepID=F9S2A1_9VIBR|nr:hypothetical protein [Vibrio ichthyoenteri]EGU39891.1 putative type IV pilin [Vibrio ichthyoenteri ATCC 700023]
MIGKQVGFTLLEVAISFSLIAIAALGLIHLQVKLAQQSGFAIQSIEALHLAERQMELYQTRAISTSGSVGLLDFNELSLPTYCGRDIIPVSGSRYHLSCEVEDVSGALAGVLKSITVEVSWALQGQGAAAIVPTQPVSHAISLSSYLSKFSEFDDK